MQFSCFTLHLTHFCWCRTTIKGGKKLKLDFGMHKIGVLDRYPLKSMKILISNIQP